MKNVAIMVLPVFLGNAGLAIAERRPAVHAADPPPPPPSAVEISNLLLSGSGCRDPGSATAALAADGRAILVDFRSLSLDTSTGRSLQYGNCSVVATLKAGPGWQFALVGYKADGSADLRSGGRAVFSVRAFDPGSPEGGLARQDVSSSFRGPVALSWKPESPSYYGCGASQIIVVSSGLFLNAGPSSAGARADLTHLRIDLDVRSCQ